MDFRVFSRNISENMHARCVREDTKQALKGNLQADGVQSRQTLFVRYCPEETLHKARLTALHAICLQIFRHIAQKSLAIRQYACGISMQSAEKSDYASYAQALFSVS